MSETEQYLKEPDNRKILKELIREVIREELSINVKGRTIYLDGNYVLDRVDVELFMSGEEFSWGEAS